MSAQPLEHNAAWRVEHTLASAKALIDSLIDSLNYPGDGVTPPAKE
ncbi:hypothetical protein [Pseudomonas sp. GWSMS-1]